jgi:hypothetical protein
MNRAEAVGVLLNILENHSFEKCRDPLLYPPSTIRLAEESVQLGFRALECLAPDEMRAIGERRDKEQQ